MLNSSSAALPASSAQHAGDAARLEVADAVERQVDRVVERAAADHDLEALGEARAVPAAPEADERGGRAHENHRPGEQDEQARARAAVLGEGGRVDRDPRGKAGRSRAVGQDVVDRNLAGVGDRQPEQRGDGERGEAQREQPDRPRSRATNWRNSVRNDRFRGLALILSTVSVRSATRSFSAATRRRAR